MAAAHKNKTVATLLALLLGGFGVHRFYLKPGADRIGLLHLCCLPVTGILYGAVKPHPFYIVLPLLVSYIVGFVEALVIGLTPDEKWDAQYNAHSGQQTHSNWVLVLLLVITMLVATTVLIGTIARLSDVVYTGGAYG
ncbi:TM2 domain-containing membrane protein YozV [Massilia aurea]|uniref:TM2 domain-containing membrane protein YozV n=1 Tax=Massilia aurea TaxID=373040 RepID=A0A7W9WVI7_9BURK|nr:NINE protein [Massilia aurea]MBB6132154.1 TM2 domain-containing membrane protein YozV [Massilia aurea]